AGCAPVSGFSPVFVTAGVVSVFGPGAGAFAAAGGIGAPPVVLRFRPGGAAALPLGGGGESDSVGAFDGAFESAFAGAGAPAIAASVGVPQVTHFAAPTTFRKSHLGQMTPRLLSRSADMGVRIVGESRMLCKESPTLPRCATAVTIWLH